jgi:putative endonuclease
METRKGRSEAMQAFYVYIMASLSRVLYAGMTNNLERRVFEHKHNLVLGFTSRYGVNELVYFEACSSPRDAIAREKEIKGWRRSKKIALVESMNPTWVDLSADWFD